jgi:hypothetical protein
MGTSSSSSGPASEIPFDPPWLDSLVPKEEPQKEKVEQTSEEKAPARRFQQVRTSLGQYISSGDVSLLKDALRGYSKKGMGGASKVAKRMRYSSASGAILFDFLRETQNRSNPETRRWIDQLAKEKLSPAEISDRIIDRIIPGRGSLEEESCRISMANAMSEILKINPNTDLLNMDSESIWTLIESFVFNEALNRIYLDVGKSFERSGPSFKDSIPRLKEMKKYIKNVIYVQIKKLKGDSLDDPTTEEMEKLLQTAIELTFKVFEES